MMNSQLSMDRLAALRGAVSAPAPEAPAPPVDPGAPVVPEAPLPPADPGIAPPDPGAAPIDATIVPATAATSPAMDAALALSPSPYDDATLTPMAEKLYSQIAEAATPEDAQKLVMDFMREQTKSAQEAALAELPKIAQNMQAAAEEWQEAADGMFKEHVHLKDYGDLMETLTRDEYGKDPQKKPRDLYTAVAERANGMLRLQKGAPSLPDAVKGGVQPTTPTKETRNDMRLREIRER